MATVLMHVCRLLSVLRSTVHPMAARGNAYVSRYIDSAASTTPPHFACNKRIAPTRSRGLIYCDYCDYCGHTSFSSISTWSSATHTESVYDISSCIKFFMSAVVVDPKERDCFSSATYAVPITRLITRHVQHADRQSGL